MELKTARLRFPDEFVRHKVLDLVGDLALLGKPILGRIAADRAGHAMHTALVSRVLRDKTLWEEVTLPEEERMPLVPTAPMLRLGLHSEQSELAPQPWTDSSRQTKNPKTTSIGRFAGNIAGLGCGLGLFLEQPIQFGAGLADQGCSELAGRALAFGRQVFHPHVQQRDVLLKPAQSLLYAVDAVSGRKHGGGSPVSHQIAMHRRRDKVTK